MAASRGPFIASFWIVIKTEPFDAAKRFAD